MDEPHVTLCPDCYAPLTPALAIARFVERPDIRILKCDQCSRLHWFVLEGGALRKMKARRTLDDPLTSANKCGRRATALARIGMLVEVAIEERGLDGDQPHDLRAGGTSRRLLRRRNAL